MPRSFLEGPLKKSLARGFKGRLTKGIIQENQPASQDDYGDTAPSDVVVTHTFEGIRENFDASWMAVALIPETDVKVMILEGSVAGGYATLKDDLVFIKGDWHKVRRVLKIDPAGATRELQCYVVEAPTP